MHIWPIFTPQTFEIPKHSSCSADDKKKDVKNQDEQETLIAKEETFEFLAGENILQSITITDTNTLVFLTPTRILLYNAKPIAPLSVYERSIESLEKFGNNKFMRYRNPYHRMEGLNDSVEISVSKNKTILYVVSEGGFLLVFQIATTLDSFKCYKDYGIEPNLYNEKFQNSEDWVNKILQEHQLDETDSMSAAVQDSEDNEVLSVFDKQNSNRIIQNGYLVHKEKKFFQLVKSLMLGKGDVFDEMPIKTGDILLKIILKFDHDIIDLFAFQGELLEGSSFNRIEILCMLFENELHILTLNNFKLQKNEVIKLENCLKLVFNGTHMFVISQEILEKKEKEREKCIIINKVDRKDRKVYSKSIKCDSNQGRLVNVFNFGERYLLLLFENELIYFDTVKNEIYQKVNLSLNVVLDNQEDKVVTGGFLTSDLFLVITKLGEFQLFSKWGNLLIQMNLFKLSDIEHEEYTSFSFIDNMIVLATKRGTFQLINCWKEICNKSFANFRSVSQYVLLDSQNNDLLIYQPTNASKSADTHRVIKLPTKSTNNSVSKVEVNGNMSIMAVYVANKKSLLMTDLSQFSNWEMFNSLEIMDMCWLGHNYLICYMNDDTGKTGEKFLRCHDFNMIVGQEQNDKKLRNLSDGKIWTCFIGKNDTLIYWNCNTFSSYTVVTKKSTNEILYKTGEINVLLKDKSNKIRLETHDILCKFNHKKEPIIRSFVKHVLDLNSLSSVRLHNIKWVYHYKMNGILLYTDDGDMYKIYTDSESPLDQNTEFKTNKILTKVERIVDVFENNIALIKDRQFLVYNLQDFADFSSPVCGQENILPLVKQSIFEEEYPIMLSKKLSIFHSLQCFYQKGSNFQLKSHDVILLDQMIESYLSQENMDFATITAKFGNSKYYMFALEKVLSSRIIEKQPLTDILELIDFYDETNFKLGNDRNEKKLQIVSNCLRKIEANRWSYLFDHSDISPNGLLSDCIKLNNGKLLGALLMVFLSYENRDLRSRSPTPEINSSVLSSNYKKKSMRKNRRKVNTPNQGKQLSLSDTSVIINESLIKQVLEILINNATQPRDGSSAHEYWSMAFQLIKFLKVYDRENNGDLAQSALKSIA